MNANDAHANVGVAANNANPYADNAVDANANDADTAYDNDNNDDNCDDNGDGGEDSKSPAVIKKVGDKEPPDTDATLPLPTSELARQADNL
jgi:hypothetical protein